VVEEFFSRSREDVSELNPRVVALTETERCLKRLGHIDFLSDSVSTGSVVRLLLLEAYVMRE